MNLECILLTLHTGQIETGFGGMCQIENVLIVRYFLKVTLTLSSN